MNLNCVLFLLTGVFYHYAVSSTVHETTESYDCTDKQQNLMSKQEDAFKECEQVWTAGNTPFAKYSNGTVKCSTPCREVKLFGIVMDECINVSLILLCEKEYITEHRINFHGKMNNPLPMTNPRARYGILASLVSFLPVALGLMFQGCRSSDSGWRKADLMTCISN